MNRNKKAAQWAAEQGQGQEDQKDLGKISPEWITFWGIVEDLNAKLDRLDAEKKAAQEAAGSSGGSAHV